MRVSLQRIALAIAGSVFFAYFVGHATKAFKKDDDKAFAGADVAEANELMATS